MSGPDPDWLDPNAPLSSSALDWSEPDEGWSAETASVELAGPPPSPRAPTRRPGLSCALFGPSNVGKTTLLAGIDRACRHPPVSERDWQTFALVDEGTQALVQLAEDALRKPAENDFAPSGDPREYELNVRVWRHGAGLFGRGASEELSFRIYDGAGGALLPNREDRARNDATLTRWRQRLLKQAQTADVLVLCLDASASEMAWFVPSITGLLWDLSERDLDAAEQPRDGLGARLLSRVRGEHLLRPSAPSRRLRCKRFLLLLTKVDVLVDGLSPWSRTAEVVQAIEPVDQAAALVGRELLYAIHYALHPRARFAVGLINTWGFCPRTGRPFREAQRSPDRLGYIGAPDRRALLWRPFGVREAVIFAATGAATGPVREVRPEDLVGRDDGVRDAVGEVHRLLFSEEL